ncbi:MAG: hypothetical protein WHT63_08670, partial [Tepidiforma sp.]
MPVSRAAAALTGIFMFILGLQVLKTGARSLVPLLDGLDIAGPVNSVGFGWLLAYAAMSGSPVAAIGVTLLAGDVQDEPDGEDDERCPEPGPADDAERFGLGEHPAGEQR